MGAGLRISRPFMALALERRRRNLTESAALEAT
jgi:hypothetical protein